MKPGWVEFAPVWGRPPVRLVDGHSDEVIRATFAAALNQLEKPFECGIIRMPPADEILVNGVPYLSRKAASRALNVGLDTLNIYARKNRWARVWNVQAAGSVKRTAYYLKRDVLRHETNRRKRK